MMQSLFQNLNIIIDIHKPAFTEKDYDVWVVAFKDKNGKELVRLDADENELNNLMLNDPSDDFVRMWRDFNTSVIPKKWLVWPHSKKRAGWKLLKEKYLTYEINISSSSCIQRARIASTIKSALEMQEAPKRIYFGIWAV